MTLISLTTTFRDERLPVNEEANNVKLNPAVQVFFGNFPHTDRQGSEILQTASIMMNYCPSDREFLALSVLSKDSQRSKWF